MLFPKNKFRPGAAFWGMALACCLAAAGCKNFINLKPVGFSLLPAADNTVLDSETAVLRIGFDTDMDKPETQKALSVSCAGGGVRGDLAWRGNELCFTPLAPWLPGVRYVLNLSGTIYALDGREERVSRHVSFYVLTREGAPWGLSFTPRDGASVGVDSAGGAFVSIVFSRAMDRESAAGAFSLEGISDREIRWSGGDTVMEVHPV
ncbi:MAG: hypothetical protein LBD09_02120, partial [Treponema sp.]|nr:hypothetical protein [Treponema sp.]